MGEPVVLLTPSGRPSAGCCSFFYSQVEGWTLLDSFYFCVMTMTTIGYGDLTPTTALSKVFTIIYAFISIGVFVSLAARLAAALFRHDHDA